MLNTAAFLLFNYKFKRWLVHWTMSCGCDRPTASITNRLLAGCWFSQVMTGIIEGSQTCADIRNLLVRCWSCKLCSERKTCIESLNLLNKSNSSFDRFRFISMKNKQECTRKFHRIYVKSLQISKHIKNKGKNHLRTVLHFNV